MMKVQPEHHSPPLSPEMNGKNKNASNEEGSSKEKSKRRSIAFAWDTKDTTDRKTSLANGHRKQSVAAHRRMSRLGSISHDDHHRRMSIGRRISHVASGAKHILTHEETDKQERDIANHRRMSHLRKFSGMGNVVRKESSARRRSSVGGGTYQARMRRQSAAAVLLEKLGTHGKPKESTWDTYRGRSFLTSDWFDEDEEEGFSTDKGDDDFFAFDDVSGVRDEPKKEKGLKEKMRLGVGEMASTAPFTGAKVVLQRGKKAITIKPKKKKKAWFLFAALLKRKVRGDLHEKLQFQHDDRRQYFTCWLSFVQTIIMIVVLLTHPFAPVGIDTQDVQGEVLLSREGVLYKENLQLKEMESFWMGPSLESLIFLGGKYAPCMRRDSKVFAEIEKERNLENTTGCCMARLSDSCIQRLERDCMTPSVDFLPNTVCGQDPEYCSLASQAPSKWDRSTITSWPKCDKKMNVTENDRNKHMTCNVVGRPCCVKTQGQCVITTQDNCKFRRGVYHPEHTLCSQVDCIAATCGNSFYNDNHPDQFYRLFISLFLCAGILHLIVALIFNFTILRDIEGYAGWFRTSLIFVLSGLGGNLWSAVLLPFQVEVGESGGMFGIFACVCVEGIQNWKNLERPMVYIGKLLLILFVMVLFGTLPMIDNFAHIFGFIYGVLLGFVFLPAAVTIDEDLNPDGYKWEVRKNLAVSFGCLLVTVGLTVLGFLLFYRWQDVFQSAAIGVFNCPFGEAFCQNFHQGQEIESRLIEY